MKFISKIFLIIFVTFLITPTVVSALEKKADISIFYNFSEEEHSHKVFKEFCSLQTSNVTISFQTLSSSLILSENLSRHDKIVGIIFIPPPELV